MLTTYPPITRASPELNVDDDDEDQDEMDDDSDEIDQVSGKKRSRNENYDGSRREKKNEHTPNIQVTNYCKSNKTIFE